MSGTTDRLDAALREALTSFPLSPVHEAFTCKSFPNDCLGINAEKSEAFSSGWQMSYTPVFGQMREADTNACGIE